MAIRMMSGLPARVNAVLTDFLPAELDLIDAEEADGITTPDIVDYYEWEQEFIPEFPAVTIRTLASTPVEVRPESFGTRVDARHRIEVSFHATIGQSGEPLTLQKLMHRYIAGAVRVLCVTKEALQTSADPTRYAEIVTWAGDAVYGPAVEQEDGAIVRTATLPIEVRMREVR